MPLCVRYQEPNPSILFIRRESYLRTVYIAENVEMRIANEGELQDGLNNWAVQRSKSGAGEHVRCGLYPYARACA